jgi:hypothetical protein
MCCACVGRVSPLVSFVSRALVVWRARIQWVHLTFKEPIMAKMNKEEFRNERNEQSRSRTRKQDRKAKRKDKMQSAWGF